jgi:hypothetical protein
MTAMTTLSKWQDQYFTLVKRVEAPVTRYTGDFAESVAKYVPVRPTFMAKVPTTSELVENQLKFRKRFVDEQAAFVRKMLNAMDPVFMKFQTAPKAAAKDIHVKPAAARVHKAA